MLTIQNNPSRVTYP